MSYLQVAFSSVVKDKVACVVPDDRVPVGAKLVLNGAVESLKTEKEICKSLSLLLSLSSIQRT